MQPAIKPHDVFISYVTEDRKIVEELVKALTGRGLRVWYAREQLYAGAKIRELINKGLQHSRYGVALISPDYNSHWSHGELFVLLNKSLLPVLHKTTIEEIALQIPGIHDIYCLSTDAGITSVADSIYKSVKRKPYLYYKAADALSVIKRNARTSVVLFLFILLLCAAAAGAWYYHSIRPARALVLQYINQRIAGVEKLSEKNFQEALAENQVKTSSLAEIMQLSKPANHNKFSFYNGIDYIESLAGLKNAGIIPAAEPATAPFGLSDFTVYLFNEYHAKPKQLQFALMNLLPARPEIIDTRLNDGLYEVDVSYTNFLRYAEVKIYPDAGNKQTRLVHFVGTKPTETLVFEKNGDTWVLLQVR